MDGERKAKGIDHVWIRRRVPAAAAAAADDVAKRLIQKPIWLVARRDLRGQAQADDTGCGGQRRRTWRTLQQSIATLIL